MLAVGMLYSLIMIYTAFKGMPYETNSMKMLRTMTYVSVVIFFLDYLLGHYESDEGAISVFADRIGLTALFGVILIAVSGATMIVSKILSISSTSRHPDYATMWRCLLHGLIISLVSFALRWLLTGNI